MIVALDPLTLPLSGSRLIEASAGTGKTWTIAALYLRLVLGHGTAATAFGTPLAPARILVMTFTVAATRELVSRVRERLVEAAAAFRGTSTSTPDAFLAALVDAYPAGAARDHAAWRLAAAAEAMDDAAIVTIDGFVQRVLREHAFDSGSVFDEVLEPDQEAMLSDAVHDYWRQEIYPLSGEALDAALAIWKKPAALLDDVRRLMTKVEASDDSHLSLAEVRAATTARRRATLSAAKEGWAERFATMRDWLRDAIARKPAAFNGVKVRSDYVEKWFDALIAWASDADLAFPDVKAKTLWRITPAGLHDAAKQQPSSLDVPPVFEAFAQRDWPREVPDPRAAMRLHAARRVKARMHALKQRAGIFGFQDQLERLDRALAGPSGARLRERIVAQYPVALIDEFQDTSPIQYRVFERLYRPAEDVRDTALLLIGDPKQSIYAFRDADIHSYLRARTATAGRHHRLTTNHRSTAALVEAVNRLFGEAESLADGAFRFGGGDDRPLPFVAVDARDRDDEYVTRDGQAPSMIVCYDPVARVADDLRRTFAECCAEYIVGALNDARSGFVHPGGRFERLRAADVAVLVRTGREAEAMRRALGRRGVASAYLADQQSVFASPEAADLVVWLRAVADPLDGRRARLAFATRLIGIDVDGLTHLATDDRLFEDRIAQLKALSADWREQGVLTMLRRTLHRFELPARWLRDGNERALTNVLHLAELLQRESARLDGEQALIRWLGERVADPVRRSDDEVVRLESDADLVKVVTVHGAKGLEYPIVCVPFACTRPFGAQVDPAWIAEADGTRRLVFGTDPDAKRRAEAEVRQEEVRLTYVALTRARHALWIGVAAGSPRDGFGTTAFGYLLGAAPTTSGDALASLLHARFDGLSSVVIQAAVPDVPRTALVAIARERPLRDAPTYDAAFERDWSIGSFSSLVRDLPRLPIAKTLVDPAVEEEVLSGPIDEAEAAVPSPAARHRFPRGAFAGNFLHDQLEWLASERFAIRDPDVRRQLIARCRRQGWGQRADDVVEWLTEAATTSLPPIGVALEGLPRILPEMEFWLPSERVAAARIDALCRAHLLDGLPRPSLPGRALRGMLMGFADLVFEVDGRYWVLDYKSNALGAADDDYTDDAIARSMAAHRYEVQGAIYLLALHRVLRQRLGARYDPARHLGGALYLYLRGIAGPARGCHVLPADPVLLDALDAALRGEAATA